MCLCVWCVDCVCVVYVCDVIDDVSECMMGFVMCVMMMVLCGSVM